MPQTNETTDAPISRQLVIQRDTGSAFITPTINEYLQRLNAAHQAMTVVSTLSQYSDATGGYVQFLPGHHYIPVLAGSNGQFIPLYRFVEIIDEALNYDSLIAEMPALSMSQIGGAIAFLRKVAQYNPSGIDLDSLEDEEIANDSEYLNRLRAAYEEETSRVLSRD